MVGRRAYPEYKDSGIEWLGEIPEHWVVWKVTHGFKQIGSGTTPKSDDPSYYDGEIPWVTTSELREIVIKDTNSKLTQMAVRDYSSLKIYSLGTLLIAMYGATIGRLGILGIAATVNQACCAFSEPIVFDMKFYFFWLLYRRPILISLSEGGGQPNLSQEILKAIRVPVPLLDEQRAIASFLDRETARIDALVEKKERQIELLKEKRSTLISHVVTKGLNPDTPMKDSGIEWLGEIPEHWDDVRSKAGLYEVKERSESGVEELLTVSHITGVTTRSAKQVSMFMAESLEGYKKCITGDLVINTMWAWMGALGIAFQCGIVSPSYNVYRFRQLGYEPRYYDRLFRTGSFVSEINRYSQGVWKSRLRLYPEEFFLIRIPRPPKNEQCAIADFLDQETVRIDTLIEKVEESIDRLREYRSALISAAVTGKIDVRGEVA